MFWDFLWFSDTKNQSWVGWLGEGGPLGPRGIFLDIEISAKYVGNLRCFSDAFYKLVSEIGFMRGGDPHPYINWLLRSQFLPTYFAQTFCGEFFVRKFLDLTQCASPCFEIWQSPLSRNSDWKSSFFFKPDYSRAENFPSCTSWFCLW